MQIVRFVDGPYSGATTRLDVSPGQAGWQLGEGYDFSPPPVNMIRADTPLDDGELVVDSTYGNRQAVVHLVMREQADMATRSAAVNALMEELQRTDNWLEIRPDGASASKFLHTYRYQDAGLLAKLGAARTWADITFTLEADPFAYGLPATATATVNSDPASGVITSISPVAGDVPTPVIWSYAGSSYSVIGSHRRPNGAGGAPTPCMVQATSAGGADSTSASDTNASGGNRITVGFASNAIPADGGTPSLKALGTNLLTAQTDRRNSGRWRVYARISSSIFALGSGSVTATYVMQAEFSAGSILGNPVTVYLSDISISGDYFWVDLGMLLDWPTWKTPQQVGFGTGTDIGTEALTIGLYAKRTAGSGNLYVDAFMVVPADGQMLRESQPQPQGSGSAGNVQFVIDPYNGYSQYAWGSDTNKAPSLVMSNPEFQRWMGRTPVLYPDATTDIVHIANVGGEIVQSTGRTFAPGYRVSLGNVALTKTMTYYPRYLTVV